MSASQTFGSIYEAASFLAGILFLVSFLPYIRSILRRETEPSKVTWIVWAMLDIIAAVGMWSEDSLNSQIIGATIGAILVAGLAFYYGKPGWTRLDYFCFSGALVGIALWWFFHSATTGVVISSILTVIAAFPTFQTALYEPHKENRTTWTLAFCSCVLAMIGIPQWTLIKATQPVSFTVNETVMVLFLWWPRSTLTGLSASRKF